MVPLANGGAHQAARSGAQISKNEAGMGLFQFPIGAHRAAPGVGNVVERPEEERNGPPFLGLTQSRNSAALSFCVRRRSSCPDTFRLLLHAPEVMNRFESRNCGMLAALV